MTDLGLYYDAYKLTRIDVDFIHSLQSLRYRTTLDVSAKSLDRFGGIDKGNETLLDPSMVFSPFFPRYKAREIY